MRSLDILDLKDYGTENIRGERYVFVVIENFIKIGWTIPLKNKSAQTVKNCFESLLLNSKRKPKLFETDRGTEFYNSIFQIFSNTNNNKHYCRNTSIGAVFAERFNRTNRDLLKGLVFERGNANWIDVLPTITDSSINLTPTKASLKKSEDCVYQNLLDKRKKKQNQNINFTIYLEQQI